MIILLEIPPPLFGFVGMVVRVFVVIMIPYSLCTKH